VFIESSSTFNILQHALYWRLSTDSSGCIEVYASCVKLHSLSWPPGGDSSGCIEVYVNYCISLLIYSLGKYCKHEFMSPFLVSCLLQLGAGLQGDWQLSLSDTYMASLPHFSAFQIWSLTLTGCKKQDGRTQGFKTVVYKPTSDITSSYLQSTDICVLAILFMRRSTK